MGESVNRIVTICFKNTHFLRKKNYKTWKETEKYDLYTRKRKKIRDTVYKKAQVSNLVGKDFKTAIINIFKEL